MKYFYLIIFSTFLILSPLKAQHIQCYGLKLGITNSDIKTDLPSESYSDRFGFNIGVFSEILPVGLFSMVLELNYVQKGFDEISIETNDQGDKIQEVTAPNKLHYFSIPVMAKFKHSGRVNSYISLGPRFEYLISKKNGVFNYTVGKYESELIDNFEEFTYGVSGAVGIELPNVITKKLLGELRYNLDLNDSVSKNNYIKIKNRSIDLWLGFMI